MCRLSLSKKGFPSSASFKARTRSNDSHLSPASTVSNSLKRKAVPSLSYINRLHIVYSLVLVVMLLIPKTRVPSCFIWISCHVPPFPSTENAVVSPLQCGSVSLQPLPSCVSLHRYTQTTAVSPYRPDPRRRRCRDPEVSYDTLGGECVVGAVRGGGALFLTPLHPSVYMTMLCVLWLFCLVPRSSLLGSVASFLRD